MLFDYAVTARVNGRDKWQRLYGSRDATATAHTLAHGNLVTNQTGFTVENVRLLILPASRHGDYDYLDQPTAEQIKYAALNIDPNECPTTYKVDEKRRAAEREIRARFTRGQLTYLTQEPTA